MYVVIFRATVDTIDHEYSQMTEWLREMALNRFGCLDFVSMMDGDQEVALSWWPDLESIHKWKKESDHLMAQRLGKEKWYKSYSVEITKVEKSYGY
ncbi:antibiotic biosynthesis monooxygenase [Sansalvadorimonas sp. 2012CJ34-2]|uniref:Antibiotic biosynthesis monooxygenase n=1 Tax=Parendozoicomonas callyspongiae TaxID=2942213 RepID=A0ABT0PHY0_9GAMM|nr:antibiotic biosynthesis monooxygenase [Sansalvadorimonas sp. 2012CJ34-2]MCL6270959.1 antibiotic biosynthesis monooxygenase [Sansalvadorimonas sp. 2012CJ34-2]